MDAVKGLDVSFYQGKSINWNQVAAAGYSFVYIKAAEGTGRIEPLASTQASGAKAAGLKIGYYFFSHAGQDGAVVEADFFNSVLAHLPAADLLPVLDLETNKMNLTIEQMTKWTNDFYTEMLRNGKEVVLYTYTSFYNQFIVGRELLPKKLWLACYQNTIQLPIGRHDYEMWQYTQKGSIPGIIGGVDLNTCPDLTPFLLSV